jgi:hypothetical protein
MLNKSRKPIVQQFRPLSLSPRSRYDCANARCGPAALYREDLGIALLFGS